MSARLMKKVLKEQEAALQQHQQLNSDDDAEFLNSSSPNRNPFDLLEDEDNNSSDDHSSRHHSDQEKSKMSGEASARGTSKQSAIAVNTVSMPNVKAKKKKKKIGEDLSPRTENEVISSELMLESLTLGASSSGHQKIAPYPATSQFVNKDSDNRKHCNSSIMQVDPKFLSAENELRRIFGSRVVKSHERSQLSVNSRLIRGGRRGNHNLKKTVLVSPSQHWPRWDGSLTMELLESKDGVHYFRYIHSSSYAQAQRAFEAAKAIHDLNGIASILLNHPYHIDSLITLADYFKFTGEHQMSADAIAKCLYAMECAWHPLFAPSPKCQLKYIHDTNKPFFSSLFTHMKNMDRRGCHRSALEICKFLLSLDSDDPMGAMLSIDYYALRAEEYAWLEQFAEEYRSDNSLWLFPNFSYSLAVCRFYLEKGELLNNREMAIGKAASCDLMKQALMLHPSVLKKLVVKVPLKDRIWTTLLQNSFFQSEQTGSPSLDHLIAIYVERSYIIWRLPDLQKLLSDSALSVIEMLKEKGSDAKDWACVRKEAFPSEKNEYAHLLVSDFSDSIPTMPPDNLQDFMVDQMARIENREQFHNIPENHMPRDLTNRNALAVLLESMLPWINYGTGDGEHVQHDLPEQVNEE
ncbi:UNVERIFIED_CONTAM: Transcription factor 25 [Sesamum radiatum]|uniref:Transcription factor 25 n=1 Tax=Sesamum radiatum TaxID=300843 RepID=A0AAW2PFB8_SESRA